MNGIIVFGGHLNDSMVAAIYNTIHQLTGKPGRKFLEIAEQIGCNILWLGWNIRRPHLGVSQSVDSMHGWMNHLLST